MHAMNTQITPISWFRFRYDAERLQSALRLSGIESTIRNVVDPPPGWKTSTSEGGVDVWVSREDFERAEEILRRTAAATHPPMLCERCHSGHATVHVTAHRDGVQSTRNLCESCYLAESVQP
jgi:hypothetical protein